MSQIRGTTTAVAVLETCSPRGPRRWLSFPWRGGSRSASPLCSAAVICTGSGTVVPAAAGAQARELERGRRIAGRGSIGGRGRRWLHRWLCRWPRTRCRRAEKAVFLCRSVGKKDRECVRWHGQGKGGWGPERRAACAQRFTSRMKPPVSLRVCVGAICFKVLYDASHPPLTSVVHRCRLS